MRAIVQTALCAAFVLPGAAPAAGLSSDETFHVLAPNQQMAECIRARAAFLRSQVSQEWLGKQLPADCGRTVITVVFSSSQDVGLTWPIDAPQRKFHQVWLTTSPARAIGSTLHHEIVHTVLASEYGWLDKLPAFVDEGVASLYDDPGRIQTRRQIVQSWATAGHWPSLEAVLGASRIAHTDELTYTAATSLVAFLLTRGDKPTLLRFATSGKSVGWNEALHREYGLQSIDLLQGAWERWASQEASQHGEGARSGRLTSALVP